MTQQEIEKQADIYEGIFDKPLHDPIDVLKIRSTMLKRECAVALVDELIKEVEQSSIWYEGVYQNKADQRLQDLQQIKECLTNKLK